MDEEEVSTRAEHTLSNFIDIISCLVEGRNLPGIHVMLPVMLYVLTMNNFFNKSSIQKRVTRNEKYKRKHGKNRGDKKAKKWEGPDDDPRYVIHHRELCAIERKIACEDTAASYRASGATETLFPDVENLYYDFSNDEDLSLAVFICKNRSDLVYFEESAYVGEFLRGILSDNNFGLDPVDTIIAMYVINKIDQVLVRTGVMGCLPSAMILDNTENGLLKWHYLSTVPQEEEMQIDSSELRKLFFATQPTTEDEEETGEKKFTEIYEDLKNSDFFSKDDIQSLLDFYLNKEGLEKGRDLRHQALLFVTQNDKKLVKGKSDLDNRETVAEFLNTIREAITFQRTKELLNNLKAYDFGEDNYDGSTNTETRIGF